jgi:hypothetical protein
MGPAEIELDREFAIALQDSPRFASWLVAQTRFGLLADESRLLYREQLMARNTLRWWKQWWCAIPGHGESATDILAVFETSDGYRFALHIADKRDGGPFADREEKLYAIRAEHMKNKAKYLDYQSFATVLIAPRTFRNRHADRARAFDHYVPYEAIAAHVPAFDRSAQKFRPAA